jgi:hypothetical protein
MLGLKILTIINVVLAVDRRRVESIYLRVTYLNTIVICGNVFI